MLLNVETSPLAQEIIKPLMTALGKYFGCPSVYFPYIWYRDGYMCDTPGLFASSDIHKGHSCTLLLLWHQIWCQSFPAAKQTQQLPEL